MFLTVVFTNSVLFFFFVLQPMVHLTVENTVQEYEKKSTYNLNLKLGSWKYGLFLYFFFQLNLIHSCLKANLFNIQYLFCYT